MSDYIALNNCPVFVVGMPRSGTTLLTTLINNSGEIFIPEETHVYKVYEQYLENKAKNNLSFSEYYFSGKHNFYLKYLNLSDSDVAVLKEKKRESRKAVLEDFIALKMKGKEQRQWGEKTPIHFQYIEWIQEDYPNAKIVVIHRDPRDVFDSIKKSEWRKFFNAIKRLSHYRMCTNLFLKKDLYNLRYEDLLIKNNDEIASLSKYLNLDENKDLNNFDNLELNFTLTNEPWKANNLKEIDKSLAYKWKKRDKTYLDLYVSHKLYKEIHTLKYEQFWKRNRLVNIGLDLYYQGVFFIYKLKK